MALSLLHAKLVNIAFSHLLVLILLQMLPSFMHARTLDTTPRKKIEAVYFFGDSILDTGNNNLLITTAKANLPPYGIDFPDHRPTGRFSNGKLTTDFIASGVGVKELVPPYFGTRLERNELLTGVCFASSGSGYDIDTAIFMAAMLMPFQLELFKDYKSKVNAMLGEEHTRRHLENSLYIVSGGSNDVVQYFVNPLKHQVMKMDVYAKFLTKKVSSFVENLVSLGAKKVGVVGIPPTGCLPFIRTLAGGLPRDCGSEYNELARITNTHIQAELKRLNEKHCNRTILIHIDMYPLLQDMIDQPAKYGFEESEKGCCATGYGEAAAACNILSPLCKNHSSYLFWDGFHPSERGCKLLVEDLLKKYEKYIYM